MTTTALVLSEHLSKATGDWLQVAVTANIGANTLIISSSLNEHDGGSDTYFEGWWVYVEDYLNETISRKVEHYYTANYTLDVYGANLTEDALNVSTIRLSRYSWAKKLEATNDALKEIYPILHKRVVDQTTISNSDLYTYPMPSSLTDGAVHSVLVNAYTNPADAAAEDTWREVWNWDIVNEGNSIRLPVLFDDGHKIKLTGIAPLEAVTTAASVVNIAGKELELLTAYAKYKLYSQMADPAASEDVDRYERAASKAYGEYAMLVPKLRMISPSRPLRIKGIEQGWTPLLYTTR